MSYEVVKSDLLMTGNIMSMYRDTITLPNNETTTREYILRGGGASAIVPIDADGKIVFVRQYRHPIKSLCLEIPAGMLEKGEDPLECATRELEEETAKKAGKIEHLVNMHSAVGLFSELIYIYLATDLKEGVQNLDHDEFVEIEKYTLEESVEMIFKGEITDSKTITGIFAYKEKMNSK